MNDITLGPGSAWSRDEIAGFLDSHRAPMRLAVATGSGFPLICSLWFVQRNGQILCATPRASKVVGCLLDDPKCGFEMAPNEPPYCGVRGHGIANISSDGSMELLGDLVDRHLGSRDTRFARWLLGRTVEEVTIAIDIEWITSWDYRPRMSG